MKIFSGVSAAAERNEDIIYVLNDNEAYMNTGVQKSGATPEGAWTTTTPSRAPKRGGKKEMGRIMAAHGVPYVATLAAGSVPMLKDFRAKVEAQPMPAADDPSMVYQGGAFVATGPFDD